jgi:hypothetical protein
MAANPSIANLSSILDAQQTVSEGSKLKKMSLLQRIGAQLDRVFETAFGDDEETTANSLRGL